MSQPITITDFINPGEYARVPSNWIMNEEDARFATPIEEEGIRDWKFGLLTGHRLLVATLLVFGIAGLYVLQSWLWGSSKAPHGILENAWSWGSLLWVTAVIPGSLGLAGLFSFKYPRPHELDNVRPIKRLVSLRIVSKGTNVEVLTDTIRRCQKEMAKTPLFPYVIEVVTDTNNIKLPEPNKDLKYIMVPEDYSTKNNSLYKARALQYAVENSELPDNAWIVHLDEETQITRSGIKGICKMIREEERSGKLRIGQGAILYHRKWQEHPFLTLVTMVP
ncbi:MAG TPA: hypothetical protein VLF39_02990 [Candidatus Saccharimonadales bacterium]|nr:hypothetical protein [Candidatus Saccharimonadales bacterium]